MSAVDVATIRLFLAAVLITSFEKTSSYQRVEKPSNGKVSEPVVWKLNSATSSSGAQRKTRAAIVKAPVAGLRRVPVTPRTSRGRAGSGAAPAPAARRG